MPIGVLSYFQVYWKIAVAAVLVAFIGYLMASISSQKLVIAGKVQRITELENDNNNLKNLNEKNQIVIKHQKVSLDESVKLIDELEQVNHKREAKASKIIEQMKIEYSKCKNSGTRVIVDSNCSNIKIIKPKGDSDEIFDTISNIGRF